MFATPACMAYHPWGERLDMMDLDGFGLLSGRDCSNRRDIPNIVAPIARAGCPVDACKTAERQHCSSQARVPTRQRASSKTETQHPTSSQSHRKSCGPPVHDNHRCHRQQQYAGRSAATAAPAVATGTQHTSQGSRAMPAQQAARAQQQQQQQRRRHTVQGSATAASASPRVHNRHRPSISITPNAAATTIQAAWRMHRLRKEYPVLKNLTAAAAQLATVQRQLQEQQQSSVAMTQKQYLELSEPVMKVLFSIDGTSSSAAELRTVRKRLSGEANQLLDNIERGYKSGSAAVAAATSPPLSPAAPTAAVAPTSPKAEIFHHCLEELQASPEVDSVCTGMDMPDAAPLRDQSSRQHNLGIASTRAAHESPVTTTPVATAAACGSSADAQAPAAPRAQRHRRRRPREQQQQYQEQLLRAGLCPSRWWLRHLAL